MTYELTVRPRVRASKGCWTCKSKKTGCDRHLPGCKNCARAGRTCEGYTIKISWPESQDGRRPLNSFDNTHFILKLPKASGNHFINTTHNDISHVEPISRSLSFGVQSGMALDERRLLSYYHERLSRMITTIDDTRNGFRMLLIPAALSGQSLSSQSLREGILALSATHLHGESAALKHKIKAIRLLSRSINQGENDIVGQLSACMILCVCDVFDGADGSWHQHLRAAETLYNQAVVNMNRSSRITGFHATWLAYHTTFAQFSKRSERWDTTCIRLPIETQQSCIIVGSVGCSMQVLDNISCINHLAYILEQSPACELPIEYGSWPENIMHQLEGLQQMILVSEESVDTALEEARIMMTADLYRLGALIYLHRSVLSTSIDSPNMRGLITRALQVMGNLRICTSPWPLFMISLEVTSDEQKIMILDVFEKMQGERRIGNVETIRGIVEAVWKTADLEGQKVRVDWKQFVSPELVPSFI